jgi:hypothetical protein
MKAAVIALVISITVSACAAQRTDKLDILGHSTQISTNPRVVEAVATVRNVGSQTAKIIRPICPLRVLAYSTAAREGGPLWKLPGEPCFFVLRTYPPIEIGARDYYEFKARVAIPNELLVRRVFLSIELPTLGLYPVGQLELAP